MYYIDTNNVLYDKQINSALNDIELARDVSQVYAIATSESNESEILITVISSDGKKVNYLTKENSGYSEIQELGVPKNYVYCDLSMVAGDKFVYVVVTTKEGLNFILKSAYEPLAASCFENITSKMNVVVSKYYTIEEYFNELMDTMYASMSMTAGIMLNYEKLIESQNSAVVSAQFEIESSTYELPSEQTVIYSVVIDKMTGNHTNRCTYADDATGFEPAENVNDEIVTNGWEERFPFNKIKPCVLRGGEFVGYIDPNDFTKYTDGSPVNSDSDSEFLDVMIEFPKIYYKVESDDTTVYIRVSNQKIVESYKCYAHVYDGVELDKIYIAAYHSGYKMYNGKNTMFSYTNTLPNCQDIVTNEEYETLLENKEIGYRELNFDQTVMLQCLFVLMFKSTGSEWSFAKGNKKRTGTLNANGLCDAMGMYAGSKSVETQSCKMFGIENIFGNIYARVEGIAIYTKLSYDTYELRRRDPYSTVPINRMGEGYDSYFNPDLDGQYYTDFYLSDPYATTEFGFLPKQERITSSVSLAYNKFYCDTCSICSSFGLWFGGDFKAYSFGGMFHYFYDYGGEIKNKNLGYRLVYYPVGGVLNEN